MKAKVRAILKRDIAQWGTVEGVDRDDILSNLKTRAAAAAGVSVMTAIKAGSAGLGRKGIERMIFGDDDMLRFPVEMQWEDCGDYERVVLTLTREEMTSEIMFGMLTGVLK